MELVLVHDTVLWTGSPGGFLDLQISNISSCLQAILANEDLQVTISLFFITGVTSS